jgi:signal transduction histidine kinase
VLKQNNTIKIIVKDNGIGFISENIHKGLGLQNIENRAKIANVEIAFSSEINVGTQIEIKLKANKIYLG